MSVLAPPRTPSADDEVPELRRRLGRALERRHATMHKRFDGVDAKLAGLETSVSTLQTSVSTLQTDMTEVKESLIETNQRVASIDKTVTGMEARILGHLEAHRRNTDGLIQAGFEEVKIALNDFRDELRKTRHR